MRCAAIFIPAPGKVEVRDIDVPDPAPDEVQVRCLANGICMYEVSVFRGIEAVPIWPAGHEGVGVVTKVGHDVKNLKEGDYTCCVCWQELANIKAADRPAFAKPLADPAVWLWEPVDCVVRALYAYDITPGDRVLLMGAGYMGLLNVQGLARYPLAELVVTDVNPDRLALAREFGATETVQVGTREGDARMEEFKKRRFDLVIEASGTEGPLRMGGELTRDGGRLALFGWQHGERTVDMGRWHIGGLRVLNTAPQIAADHRVNTMERAVRLMERGVFRQQKLISHRWGFRDVRKALETIAARPRDYIKGVLMFE